MIRSAKSQDIRRCHKIEFLGCRLKLVFLFSCAFHLRVMAIPFSLRHIYNRQSVGEKTVRRINNVNDIVSNVPYEPR